MAVKMAAGTCSICNNAHNGMSTDQVVYEDQWWRLRHSGETNILGYLVLEPKRHFLDMSEASIPECTSYGVILKQAINAIRSVTGCSRVYQITLAEAVPHFHVHLIPRTDAIPKAYRGRGILSYPLRPVTDSSLVAEVCLRLRKAISREVRSISDIS